MANCYFKHCYGILLFHRNCPTDHSDSAMTSTQAEKTIMSDTIRIVYYYTVQNYNSLKISRLIMCII